MEKILIGIGLLVVILLVIFAIKYFSKDTKGKEEAEQFLKDLEDQLYNIILGIINNFDIADYKTLEEFEVTVLNTLYDGCWEFVEKKIKEADSKNLITVIAQKFLTKEYINKFIDYIMSDKGISEELVNIYGAYKIENTSEALIEEDKRLEEEFSNEELYQDNINVDTDLEPASELEQPTDEELAELNPPSDDEEEYSDDDTSVEEVTDYIVSKKSSNGQERFYLVDGATGKKKQVSKIYVQESNLEIRES